jgi:hypothetical protein
MSLFCPAFWWRDSNIYLVSYRSWLDKYNKTNLRVNI